MNIPPNTMMDVKIHINQQLHCLERDLTHSIYNIQDMGELIPASVMVHNLHDFRPNGVTYMNNWGSERMGVDMQEINQMGDAYYSKYFVEEDLQFIFPGVVAYCSTNDFSTQYNFFQRVKQHKENDYKWFYSVCKLLRSTPDKRTPEQLIMVSSPVEGMGNLISKVNKALDDNAYLKLNYRKFSILTKREKEIISMIANGKSSKEISDSLFISTHTVNTHRKNIIRKTEFTSFAGLLKFAIAFELV